MGTVNAKHLLSEPTGEWTMLNTWSIDQLGSVTNFEMEVSQYMRQWDILRLDWVDVTNTTDAQSHGIEVSTDNGASYISTYHRNLHKFRSDSASAVNNFNTTAASIEAVWGNGNDAWAIGAGSVSWHTLRNFRGSCDIVFYCESICWSSTQHAIMYAGHSVDPLDTPITTLKWEVGGGNIDGGNWKLYGSKIKEL